MNAKTRTIKTIEGNYGKTIVVWVQEGVCFLCGQRKLVIASDGSDDEYGFAMLCADCVQKELERGLDER